MKPFMLSFTCMIGLPIIILSLLNLEIELYGFPVDYFLTEEFQFNLAQIFGFPNQIRNGAIGCDLLIKEHF